MRDRVRGALIGLAVGDAVGTTVEFKPPGTFPPVTDMVGGGPFGLRPGEWTDDTSMALCLAESLIECGGFNACDQMGRYVKWWRHGHLSSIGRCFDIGNTTRAALSRFEQTGDPFSGSTSPNAAGNGSLMRLAPVAMFYVSRPEEGIAACGESSRTTHGAREAIDACRYFGGLLIGAMNGVSKAELLSPMYSPVPGLWEREPLAPKIAEVARGSFARRSPPEIEGTGYVVRSLEAALWAFATTDNYRVGCLAAVNLGDDADTTAAVCGQIAGAYNGESGIPGEWRKGLARESLIDRYAESVTGLLIKLPA
jgi:ADP-ribosyl-[dinitrogen reductase] hydrolase